MEDQNNKDEKVENKSSPGNIFLIGLGLVLGSIAVIIGTILAYGYFTKKKNIYTIGGSAFKYKDNEQSGSIFKKLKAQNSLKTTIIDNTNDENYIRANSLNDYNNLEKEKEFKCPITQKIMEEPVITPYGTTYEKSAIIDWIKKNNVDFETENFLSEDMLVTNYILKIAIKEYKESKNLNLKGKFI